MTKLTPQTVYIPTENGGDCNLSYPDDHINLEKKENQYILSKEDIIELLGKSFNAGGALMAYDFSKGIKDLPPDFEQFINNILNNQ